MVGLTLKVAASIVDQVNVTSEPTVTEAGVALKLTVGVGGGGTVTVTVTACCALPPAPVATAV
jgi:hypothetical protein